MALQAVARVGAALEDAQLRLVGDVAHGAGLRAAAEQRPLRALQNFHAIDVGQVEIDVARGKLHRLFVQIDRHVREIADGGAGLAAGEA